MNEKMNGYIPGSYYSDTNAVQVIDRITIGKWMHEKIKINEKINKKINEKINEWTNKLMVISLVHLMNGDTNAV